MSQPGTTEQAHALRHIGRYELIAEIAKGGMATVLLGRLAGAGGFQRLCAIKVLHRRYAQDASFIDMLLDEARIAAMIHHPNVVPILEVGANDEHGHYLVMDYVEGVSLWELLGTFGEPEATRWRICSRVILDALNGLDAAHTQTDDSGQPLGVVHRDISPQNILVSVDGIARVTDFGIAKAAARMSTTRAGQVKGKLAYMSPEQARGGKVDARTDVFALGIVMWESMTGRRLFRRDTDSETYARLLQAPIPSLERFAPGIPESIDAICQHALTRDVPNRFRSAGAMAEALENAARAHGMLADAREVSSWIRDQFAPELAARRDAIRAVSSGSRPAHMRVAVFDSVEIPVLPERTSSGQVAPPPGTEQQSGVTDMPANIPDDEMFNEDGAETAKLANSGEEFPTHMVRAPDADRELSAGETPATDPIRPNDLAESPPGPDDAEADGPPTTLVETERSADVATPAISHSAPAASAWVAPGPAMAMQPVRSAGRGAVMILVAIFAISIGTAAALLVSRSRRAPSAAQQAPSSVRTAPEVDPAADSRAGLAGGAAAAPVVATGSPAQAEPPVAPIDPLATERAARAFAPASPAAVITPVPSVAPVDASAVNATADDARRAALREWQRRWRHRQGAEVLEPAPASAPRTAHDD